VPTGKRSNLQLKEVFMLNQLSKALCGVCLMLAMLTVSATISPLQAQRSTVIGVPNDDAEMSAAIAKARTTLPEFWKSFAAPKAGEEGFAVKVRFATGAAGSGEGEHIWVNSMKKQADGGYSAKLSNQPRNIAGKNAGDTVTFKDADISDWTFMRKGKIVGNETMRPLLAKMPKAEADKLKQMLEAP
jgi:uncharacterized protein YegJ (DUF2314 family)